MKPVPVLLEMVKPIVNEIMLGECMFYFTSSGCLSEPFHKFIAKSLQCTFLIVAVFSFNISIDSAHLVVF